ncbi:hypothetical protein PPTG_20765 [Phytophthora nicotianae INRA-310]|uniref:Uncharacterized protein n=2 Tax=Phytophthora nicotianae TaxID=4792 RepID=W2RHY3_PHYN3|nr:hypothetical protein PPTG_20765 [Phytophthora nicotianae INRA-310]ETN24185.1 hypothetical protein PPTG_20765 [Phytophthora nicotianae INRA-310]ETO85644.1 hypothetical protein F444_00727 [Phytophthora nicotianae P1976]
MDEQAAPATYTIAPVPPNEYLSEREAEGAIHQWTRAHNYNVSRQKVEKNKKGKFATDFSPVTARGNPKTQEK